MTEHPYRPLHVAVDAPTPTPLVERLIAAVAEHATWGRRVTRIRLEPREFLEFATEIGARVNEVGAPLDQGVGVLQLRVYPPVGAVTVDATASGGGGAVFEFKPLR